MYYDYPPPTYLEYPILIAQGESSLFPTLPHFYDQPEYGTGVYVKSQFNKQLNSFWGPKAWRY